MKRLATIFALSTVVFFSATAFASPSLITIDFNQIFAAQGMQTAQYAFNLYEEGCDSVDFIVPAGTHVRVRAVDGAQCGRGGRHALSDGSVQYRLILELERDSSQQCQMLIQNETLGKQAEVAFGCIGNPG